MFIGYEDTQEKINYLRNTKDLNGININWTLTTLEQLNKKAERYEEIISAIANIDTMFMMPNGDDREWNDKEALQKIEEYVQPVWEEVANRRGQFPTADKDWKELQKESSEPFVYQHRNFGEMTKEQLDLYLSFSANILSKLNGFEVWEAENIFDSDDDKKWNQKVIDTFSDMVETKNKLESKIISGEVKNEA